MKNNMVDRAKQYIEDNPHCTIVEIYEAVTGLSFPDSGHARTLARTTVNGWNTAIRKEFQGTNMALQAYYLTDEDGEAVEGFKRYHIGRKWVESAKVKGNHGKTTVQQIFTDMNTRFANTYQQILAARGLSQSKKVTEELNQIADDFYVMRERLAAVQQLIEVGA